MANKGKSLQSTAVICEIMCFIFTLINMPTLFRTFLFFVFIVIALVLDLAETWTFVDI